VGKFLFSATGSLVVAEFLGLFSNSMLNMPWQVVVVHALTIAVLSCTLSGVSVGLGACMPNFRENDPSKIAVGMGGTLNLVACLLVLIVVVVLMAGPWHLRLIVETNLEKGVPWWLYGTLALGAGLGLSASFLTMRAGMRNLRRMEF
jgi:ABC-2 type transport system permease protein